MPIRKLVPLFLCLLLSGCFLRPHRIDVQQGNYVDEAMLARLKPDMTRAQARFVLGTPLIADAFHPDRWDYLFVDRKGRSPEVRQHRVTVIFLGDALKHVVTDLPGQSFGAPAAVEPPAGAVPSAPK